MKRIWCCIPAYNNAATIADVAARCRLQCENVLVVDDGSTDANLPDLLKSQNITVLRHATNQGKGAALMTAFRFAAEQGAEYLITLDADGQHFPQDIPLFLPPLAPDTIVIGRREKVTGIMPKSSLFGREFSDFWIAVETGKTVHDSQSGFRAYPVAPILALKLTAQHYNFEMEVLSKSLWAGLRAESVPIQVWYPEPDKQISSFHPLRDNARISRTHFRLVMRTLLPFPHHQLIDKPSSPPPGPFETFRTENSTPLGLAFATGVTSLPAIALWPWGIFLALYLASRLHLNKIITLAVLAFCMTPAVPRFSQTAGRMVLQSASPAIQRFVGAHIVGVVIAVAASLLVYIIAKRLRTAHP